MDKMPWMLSTALVVYGMGIPSWYVGEAPWHCGLFTLVVLALSWCLFRGYRQRVVNPASWQSLATYFTGFVILDHMVNLYCFLRIEVPVDFPFVASPTSLVTAEALLTITLIQVGFTLVNAGVLGILMRLLATPWPWPIAMRVAIYSLPASLVIALPGVDSWKVGLTGLLLVQAFTVVMLHREGILGPRARRS